MTFDANLEVLGTATFAVDTSTTNLTRIIYD